MKDDMNKIFGEELDWFYNLKLSDKAKVIYYAISMIICFGVIEYTLLGLILAVANYIISICLLTTVPGDGIKDE